jgi:hypothetical protein
MNQTLHEYRSEGRIIGGQARKASEISGRGNYPRELSMPQGIAVV